MLSLLHNDGTQLAAERFVVIGSIQTYPGMILKTSQVTL